MEPVSESRERSRQACEACRRKKTKCPAERPICSFCERLNIPCSYLPREYSKTSSAVRKATKPDMKDRVRVLESQVNDLYQALQTATNRISEMSPNTVQNDPQSSLERSNILNYVSAPTAGVGFSISDPEPPADVLDYFVQVYRLAIHFQPLPLLCLDGLAEYLSRAPRCLRWSFLAFTLPIAAHQFYAGNETEAIELYARGSEETTGRLVAEGVSNVELIQSLCLLVLSHIREQRIAQAWMVTGTAARLEMFRVLTRDEINDYNSENSRRCYWSVFILERTFFPQQTSLQDSGSLVDYPPSHPLPPSIPPERATSNNFDILTSDESVKDLGINAYLIQIISIWGDVASHLHETRSGKSEIPWSSHSTHARLTMRLHEFESQIPQSHLLQNLLFSRRSRAELVAHHEYWMPWIMMQIISHSSSAMVNHPFIHLVALKGIGGISHSSNFLQQTIDQAIFHSGWVFRLIRTCEDLEFELHSPFIGHLVAATATIPWIFQFAKDQQVSSNADRDLGTCARFLGRAAATWPSISQKLDELRTLQSVAESDIRGGTGEPTTIRFQPSVLWNLIDPKLRSIKHKKTTREGTLSRGDSGQDTHMRVATNFVHPLVDEQSEQPVLSGITSASAFPGVEELEQLPMSELFTQFSSNDLNWLYP